MTAAELKKILSEQDIRMLLTNFMGAVITRETDDFWISNTVCHHGNKDKLYFYKDTKTFYCYTECGSMDIIGLVMNYNGFDKYEIYKSINWICSKLNIVDCPIGFGEKQKLSDWEFILRYKKKKSHNNNPVQLPIIDDKVLQMFQPLYPSQWITEGISVETMKKYNILYSTWKQQIIIPHYDIENRLIGIRGRNMIYEDECLIGKYTPLQVGKTIYNHPLGRNLFGLNFNQNGINKKHKILLVEGEKSVLQADTMFGDNNFTVALCGNSLSDYQKNIILNLNVNEVIIGLDRQFERADSDDAFKWAKHIKRQIIDKLSAYVKVSVLWDSDDLLPYKASPTDCGKEILLKLFDSKIYVSTNN